jgi:DnaJ-class molecular chaperone
VVTTETVKVQVPPGIEDATALRIPGHGAPSPEAGGVPGDAYVIVRTAPDARFERRGADLWRGEEISVADAALGTTRTLSTLDGDVAVTIPPGTQPGTVMRVAAKGLPRFGRPGRGDLYVSIAVRIPERLDARRRRAYERLRELDTGG